VDKISGYRTRWSKATSFAVALAMAASACAHAQARTEPPRPALSPEPASVRIAPRNVAPTLSPASRDALRKAFAAAAAGRWDEAQKLAAPHPLGARVLLWTQLLRGGQGFEAVAAFIDRNPDWPLRDTLMRRAEEALPSVADDARVIAWFGDRRPLTPPGTLRLAQALRAVGDGEAAARTARGAWRQSLLGERGERELLAAFGDILGPDDHAARVDRMLWERRFVDAQRILPMLGDDHRLLAQARMALARNGADAASAEASVPAGLAGDPGLLYERARFARRAGQDDRAAAIFRAAPADLRRPEIWWQERDILARRLLRDGRAAEALSLVAAHGLRPEHGQDYTGALFLEGWIALRRTGDVARARAAFQKLHDVARTPVTQARGAYWMGRALEAAGSMAEARAWYVRASAHHTVFYGQLALLRLPEAERPELPEPPTPTREERARIEGGELGRAAALLSEIGEHERAKHFARRLSDVATTHGEHRAAAQFALALGRPDLAVSLAKRSAQRAGMLLGEEGWPVIRTPAGSGVERALVLATIRQESAFEADAVSPAGARGLMQLMPQTARGVAERMGKGGGHTLARLTTDPDYNITLGQNYMAGLLSNYDGATVIALAAYNAGPGRAAQWIRENGDPRSSAIDPVDWIEMISFDETRNYVQRVMENLNVYRRRLGDHAWAVALARDLSRD
jgi:soluble lytic murein transglycosylase